MIIRLAWLTAAVLSALPAWAADQPDGKVIYATWCAPCHDARQPGAVALEAKYKGAKPAILTERTDLSPQLTKFFVRKGVSIMPFFRKTEISDTELAALGEYLSPENRGKR